MKLNELFNTQELNANLKWYNEPLEWRLASNQLAISPAANTDFWQRTHYGFQADNGPFLFAEVQGDFTIEAEVACEFKNQYDQAGLMVRVSDQCWVKTSVEYEAGEPNKLGVVVTNNGYSDWSTQDVSDEFTSFKLKISRKNSDYKVEYYHQEQKAWIQMRLFHLFDQAQVQAGIYCCSPKKSGFRAIFKFLKIE